MKANNILFGAVLAAATLFGAAVSTANAAPIGTPAATIDQTPTHQEVNYRGGRYHCHWRGGRKFCHGAAFRRHRPGYGYGDGYRRSPGITLRFGSDNRGYRNRHYR